MSTNNNVAGGNGLFFLFILFLVLKLTGLIAWSWWWVTCPFWIPPVIVLSIFAVGGIVALIGLLIVGIVALIGLLISAL